MSSTPTRSSKDVVSISGGAKNARAVTVTPSPVASEHGSAVNEKASFPELKFLCQFLGISTEKNAASLDEFLSEVGCETLGDLALLQEGDFEDTSVSLMTQRKLLLVADFLKQGGSLENVDSMKELGSKTIHGAKAAKAAIPNGESSDEAVVVLDVGGHRFTTTKETLCRVPGSLLESMFSGRHKTCSPQALRKQDGSYVIDRDGTHFQHILNFLRVGAIISLPSNAASKDALAIEADYYGLEALVRAIRMPQVDTSEHLSEEVLSMRHEEDMLREAFMNGSARDFDPHRGLVSLFCPENGVASLPLTYGPIEDASTTLMDNLRKNAPTDTPVTASSLEEFRSNFNREHPNVLRRLSNVLLEEEVIIAGGAVLRALTSKEGIRTADWWGEKSDIDLFLHCKYPQEANRIARRIFFALAVDNERWAIMRSRGVITMHNWIGQNWRTKKDLKVQIVLRLYDSPSEVLVGFDCDSCCCAYDGRAVWLTPRCLRALRTGINVLNPLHAWPNKLSYELRLAKYAYRGFAVSVPGFDKKRVDYDRIRHTDLSKLKGLARLLKITFEMDESPAEMYSFGRLGLSPPRFQSFPRSLHTERLYNHVKRHKNECERLLHDMSGYFDQVDDIIVPQVYGSGDPHVYMWSDYSGGEEVDFPRALECRDDAWRDIVNSDRVRVPEGVSEQLVNAWDTEKRSREYLNSDMDKVDLDNVYYNHAYVDETNA